MKRYYQAISYWQKSVSCVTNNLVTNVATWRKSLKLSQPKSCFGNGNRQQSRYSEFPWCNHGQCSFFSYDITRHVTLFSDWPMCVTAIDSFSSLIVLQSTYLKKSSLKWTIVLTCNSGEVCLLVKSITWLRYWEQSGNPLTNPRSWILPPQTRMLCRRN